MMENSAHLQENNRVHENLSRFFNELRDFSQRLSPETVFVVTGNRGTVRGNGLLLGKLAYSFILF